MSALVGAAAAAYLLIGVVVAGLLDAEPVECIIVVSLWPLVAAYMFGQWLRLKVGAR